MQFSKISLFFVFACIAMVFVSAAPAPEANPGGNNGGLLGCLLGGIDQAISSILSGLLPHGGQPKSCPGYQSRCDWAKTNWGSSSWEYSDLSYQKMHCEAGHYPDCNQQDTTWCNNYPGWTTTYKPSGH